MKCGKHDDLRAKDATPFANWARKFSPREPTSDRDAAHVVRGTFNAAIKATRVKLSLRRLLDGETNIELPHNAYLYFLREILLRDGIELQAVEAITGRPRRVLQVDRLRRCAHSNLPISLRTFTGILPRRWRARVMTT